MTLAPIEPPSGVESVWRDDVQHTTSLVVSDASVGDVLAALRRRRGLASRVFTAVFTVVAILLLVQPREYQSSMSFMVQGRGAAQGLQGLASQFGIAMPNTEPTSSPAFYADVVMSREVLGRLANGRYAVAGVRDSQPLAQLLGVDAGDSAVRHFKTEAKLRRMVASAVMVKSGTVRVTVEARRPELAYQLASRIATLVNTFNVQTRQSRAHAERAFTERQFAEARAALLSAENALEAFLVSNREYRSSPILSFEQDRLSRAVSFRQQVYTALAQALEQARTEEVRDTPATTVVEAPELPALPESRQLPLKLAVAALLAAFTALFAVVLRERHARPGRQ